MPWNWIVNIRYSYKAFNISISRSYSNVPAVLQMTSVLVLLSALTTFVCSQHFPYISRASRYYRFFSFRPLPQLSLHYSLTLRNLLVTVLDYCQANNRRGAEDIWHPQPSQPSQNRWTSPAYPSRRHHFYQQYLRSLHWVCEGLHRPSQHHEWLWFHLEWPWWHLMVWVHPQSAAREFPYPITTIFCWSYRTSGNQQLKFLPCWRSLTTLFHVFYVLRVCDRSLTIDTIRCLLRYSHLSRDRFHTSLTKIGRDWSLGLFCSFILAISPSSLSPHGASIPISWS